MIVANTSPLIILGKLGRIDTLHRCFKKILIPKAVYDEIMEKKTMPEAIALNEAIRNRRIEVKQVKVNSLLTSDRLGKGEKEAISLAIQSNSELIIDDDSAKTYASVLGVKTHGTLYVLLCAVKEGIITKPEFKSIIQRMLDKGFYISTELYTRLLNMLDQI